jgi:cytochrome c-type biogenesis protein CcmH
MTLFIICAAAITLISVLILIRPMLKPKGTVSYERHAQNIHFAKERMVELEEQLKNASISAEEYEALKFEIESNLALDIDIDVDVDKPTNKDFNTSESNGVIIALLACIIPFSALILYQITGTPKALSFPQDSTQRSVPVNSSSETKAAPEMPADIETMVSALEERMKNSPEDLQGWTMLARSYASMGRYADAIRANEHILKVGGENADILTALADSTALELGGRLAGKPMELVNRALRLNGQHPHALWLAGLGAAQIGKLDDAKRHWNDLLPLLANQPGQQEELRDVMRKTFGTDNTATSSPELASQQPLPSSTNTTDDKLAATASVSVYVTIDQNLLAQSSPSDLVFVFARAQSGPPAPLAVKRITVADLPVRINLSDADSMIPQFKLSMFDEVSISARVAKSGNPVAQPGDFQSIPTMAKSSDNAVIELEINQVVPSG